MNEKRMGILSMKKKCTDILSGVKSEHTIFFSILRGGFSLICFLLLLMPGIWFDRAYGGYCSLGEEIVAWFRNHNMLGISYQKARSFLNGNFAVVITLLSIFVTMNGNIAERSEKKVFGISRQELKFVERAAGYQRMRNMIWHAPGLMLLFINIGYCLTCYLLLIYCYFFLLRYYVLYHKSYSKEKDREAVIDRLLSCFGKETEKSGQDLLTYQSILEDIRNSIETTGDQKNAELLFKQYVSSAMEYKTECCFQQVYFFFKIVFWRNGRENRDIALFIMESYMSSLGSCLMLKKPLDDRKFAVLWGMLCAQFDEIREEEMIDFMKWFLGLSVRSRELIRGERGILELDVIQRQALQILFLSEIWLTGHPVCNLEFAETITRVWGYAECVPEEEAATYWQTLCELHSLLPENRKAKTCACADRLYQDIFHKKEMGKISAVRLAAELAWR